MNWQSFFLTVKERRRLYIFLLILGLTLSLYFGGLIGQLLGLFGAALMGGIIGTNTEISEYFNIAPLHCIKYVFTHASGIIGFILAIGIYFIFVYYSHWRKEHPDETKDDRGFKVSNKGTYGTAGWMNEKKMKEIYEVGPLDKVEGTILGLDQRGNAVCMPVDTFLNRNIAVYGAAGTWKSSALVRPAIYQSIKRGESVIISDPKGEMYDDTAELFRRNGYDVKVFNLVDPKHSDSWNCMGDLKGDALQSQILSSVIIENTKVGKGGDQFWDNNESNLLKALVLLVDQSELPTEQKNISTVYNMITGISKPTDLDNLFVTLPDDHPAKAPYNLYAQSSDTVKTSTIVGLGTRLQILQDKTLATIVSNNDIDLIKPGKEKCAYFVILRNNDNTMNFLSSLFFTFFFSKITEFADSQPGETCPVKINMILDEFCNIGKIGAAADGSDFAKTISTIRSRGVRTMLAIQSVGQFQNRYANNLWAEISGNCDIQILLGCTDTVTAKYFSDLGGTMTIVNEGYRQASRTFAVAQMHPEYSSTISEGKRSLMNPDEILHMPQTQLLVATRGQNLLRLNKVNYKNHYMGKEAEKIKKTVQTHISNYEPQKRHETVYFNALESVSAAAYGYHSDYSSDEHYPYSSPVSEPYGKKQERDGREEKRYHPMSSDFIKSGNTREMTKTNETEEYENIKMIVQRSPSFESADKTTEKYAVKGYDAGILSEYLFEKYPEEYIREYGKRGISEETYKKYIESKNKNTDDTDDTEATDDNIGTTEERKPQAVDADGIMSIKF